MSPVICLNPVCKGKQQREWQPTKTHIIINKETSKIGEKQPFNKEDSVIGSRFNALEDLGEDFGGLADVDALTEKLKSIPNPFISESVVGSAYEEGETSWPKKGSK